MIHAEALSKIGMNPDALKKGVGRVMQKPWHVQAHHEVIVDHNKCTGCGLCISCDYGALEMHPFPLKSGGEPSNPQRLIKPQVAETLGKSPGGFEKQVVGIDENCVGCDWCVSVCPTDALTIVDKRRSNNHAYWDNWSKDNVRRQANTGAKLLVSMGAEGTSRSREPYQQRVLDYLRFDAAQVTNPSIDPLREPMELRTHLGGKPSDPSEPLPPQLKLDLPFMIAHMSFGALSPHAVMACAMAAKQLGIIMGTGEGGLYE
ncbi:MAG: 4Fe-4S binding protein, partial [Deinococcus sp.]|nr:4Fe-4S binding protein [Deinococcus sp.]